MVRRIQVEGLCCNALRSVSYGHAWALFLERLIADESHQRTHYLGLKSPSRPKGIISTVPIYPGISRREPCCFVPRRFPLYPQSQQFIEKEQILERQMVNAAGRHHNKNQFFHRAGGSPRNYYTCVADL